MAKYTSNRTRFLLLLIVGIPMISFCQQKFSEKATYKIYYKFSFAIDTTDLSKRYTEEMCLFIGTKYSVFRNVQYELYEAKMEKMKKQIMLKLIGGSNGESVIGFSNTIPTTEIFQDIINYSIYKKEVLAGKNYLMEDKINRIKWIIEDETKTIGGILCQKARGVFRGRNYFVWFAPSIPFSGGPWKLGGLPGLIMEAADQKKEVLFTFLGIQQLDEHTRTIISLPNQYVKTKAKDFEKLKNIYLYNSSLFVANQNAASGISVYISDMDNRAAQKKKIPKSPFNNAMELTKEK